ncbi:MAG: CRTAC1 family protein [Candidatus Angelobacter sp. Gp1-AA117]|nr:MAG: CRTAC1 family protein [Candidatus Angelobacter sp. Gp1-AA117]
MDKLSKLKALLLSFVLVFQAGAPAAQNSQPVVRFEEIAAKAGMRVQHHTHTFHGKNADVLHMFTSGGAAVAVGDYDNDGFEDIFITDSDTGKPNHLFHNNGNFTFTDVAAKAGVAGGNDPLSVVSDALWFDYDNDGKLDLLIARFGTPILYHNEGNGKFKDVTATSGLNKFGNSIAVIAFDYDNDGYLDLLFGNYFKPVNLLDLKDPHVLPNDLDNATNGGGVTLWRNTGKGSFEEVTQKAGLANVTGWVLDVGHGDLNNDGLQDIYIACDYGTDHVFLNNGNGTFREITEKATGWDTKKGMNVDVADYDNDGWMDIYVTNITDEYMKECNMLWHNNADGTFTDVSRETGTCDTGWGWAAKFADFDNDGWQDLFVVNGLRSAGPESYVPLILPVITTPGLDITDPGNWPDIGNRTWSGYQKKRLFRNLANGTFKEISAEAGVDNQFDGRGIGIGDFDNDGRLDMVQTNADQPLLLFHNVSERTGNWIELKLIGTKSNRDAIGARVKVAAGGITQIREVDGGNGYAGQSTRRVHFGLGGATTINHIEIRWPSGRVESVTVPVNKISYIEEGRGVVPR